MRNPTIAVAFLCAGLFTQLAAQKTPFGDAHAIVGQRIFPHAIASLDVDLDGYPDLVASNGLALDTSGPFEAIALNASLEVAKTRNAARSTETGIMTYPCIVSGHFGGRGLTDVACLSDQGVLSVYLHEHPGPRENRIAPFARATTVSRLTTMVRQRSNELARTRYFDARAVDVDGDGVDEIALSYHVVAFLDTLERSGLALLHKLGDAKGFHESTVLQGDIRDFAHGDFDGDGDVDFVAIEASGDLLFAWRRGGRWQTTKEPAAHLSRPSRIQALDLDGDGTDDFVLSGGGDKLEMWAHYLQAAGSGTRERVSLELASSGLRHVEELQALDADSDGDLDLVVFGTNARKHVALAFFENGAKGALRFVATQDYEIDLRADSFPVYPSGLAPADFDRDGDLDLAFGGAIRSRGTRMHPWILENTTDRGRRARRIALGTQYTGLPRPTLSFGPEPRLGNGHFHVRLGNVPAGRDAALLLDWRNLRIEAAGVQLITGLWRSFGTRTQGSGEAGYACLRFEIPRDPSLLAFEFRFQWVVDEPAAQNPFGVLASDGWTLALLR